MKDKCIYVLHVVSRWGQGGVERFIEGVISASRRNYPNVVHEILSICSPVVSDIECLCFGPLVSSTSFASMLQGARNLEQYLLAGAYDCVHIHTNNAMGYIYANVAERAEVPIRIVHSHNTSLGFGSSKAKLVGNRLLCKLYSGSETRRLACSNGAGRHLFGTKEFTVVPNGIDVDHFAFSSNRRRIIRDSLQIPENSFVVGCVGSLIQAKNHERAIEIFARFLKYHSNLQMIIVGDGELRSQLDDKAEKLGLKERLIWIGYVDDVAPYYDAMDALLFPSFYEGYPVALVEAQCSGLWIVASDAITSEVSITSSIFFESLDSDNDIWCNRLLSLCYPEREKSCESVRKAGFDSSNTVAILVQEYGLQIRSDGETCEL